MTWKLFGSTGAALALAVAPAPLLAQDAADDAAAAADAAAEEAAMAEIFGALAGAFEVEPLTPEQQARMPLARELVSKVMPEGALMEVMGGMFDSAANPFADLVEEADGDIALRDSIGYSASELELDDAARDEVLAIVDPAWRERHALETEMAQTMITEMAARMEPLMRDAMAELYAIYFDDTQLADINTFFSTETGAAYARESYRMANDPRLAAAMFSDPEALFGPMMESASAMEAAMAAVPASRSLAELSDAEVARLTELTGLTREDLDYAMGFADEWAEDYGEGWEEEEAAIYEETAESD